MAVLAMGSLGLAPDSCPARVTDGAGGTLRWIPGPPDDRDEIDEWCRAVGPPIFLPDPAGGRAGPFDSAQGRPPRLDDLVVLTWNAHLAEGRLSALVQALRRGDLTDGKPVTHFVLLVQEMFRRGPAVPAFSTRARSAFAIRARDPQAPDVHDQAVALGLATLYVPSMRNGSEVFEDRGNAIFSTEPLSNAFALELPLQRQRRVAIGAAIDVLRDGVSGTLRVVNLHLEPLSSPRSLWVFRNPRPRQLSAILNLLERSHFEEDVTWAGTALGGDFNTVQAGTDEDVYKDARAWSTAPAREDRRLTHLLGRLDFLFFRLPPGLIATVTRLNEKFGSDHYPVLGRVGRLSEQ